MFVFPRHVFPSYRRHLPDIISNKIRTCATSKTVHNLKLIDESTATKGKECRLLQIDENVRILFISDTKRKNESCFVVRVGVGYDDDNTERVGISHLLEHVIVNTLCPILPFRIGGRTWNEMTEYKLQLQGSSHHLFKQLDSLSELMFSSTSIDNEKIIIFERKRVDAEFHIKRTDLGTRMQQILQFGKLPVPRFGCGNLDTLKGNVDVLKIELAKRHGLYRKRPVFVCIYSSLSLDDIQESFLENFWIFKNYSRYTQKTEHRPREDDCKEEEPTPKRPRKDDCKEEEPTTNPIVGEPRDTPLVINSRRRLFVVKSDADSFQLQILFPVNTRLSIQQRNSLEIISHLLNYPQVINLEDVFLHKRIGTRCYGRADYFGFQVAVDLFNCERDQQVQKATTGIFQFIKFVCDSWDQKQFIKFKNWFFNNRLSQLTHKNPIEYAEFITKNCDEIKNKFSENNLCETVADNECKYLITHAILENQDAVYSIVTRDTAQVIRNLVVGTSPKMETESVCQTRFWHTDLKLHKHEDPVFAKEDIDNFYNEHPLNKNVITKTVSIKDPSDLAYQTLCVASLMIRSRNFRKNYNLLLPGDTAFYKTSGDKFDTLQKFMDDSNVMKRLGEFDAFNMDDEDFRNIKEYKMRILADLLTDSKKLAKSLLTLAVQNIHCPVEIHPIMQYDNLRVIDRKHYSNHFNHVSEQDTIKKLEEEDGKNRTTEELIIPAINKNELNTVTLNFFQGNGKTGTDKQKVVKLLELVKGIALDVRKNYGIYTIKCNPFNIGSTSGIVIETYTVEKTDSNEKVREEIIGGMIKNIYQSVESNEEDWEMWKSMNDIKCCIQIYGHTSSEVLDTTFEDQFGKWFDDDMKTKFKTFFQNPLCLPRAA